MSHTETIEKTDTHRVVLIQQEFSDGADPRDADNLGVMWCSHTGYTLGDEEYARHIPEFGALTDFIREVKDHQSSLAELNQAIVKHLVRKHGATVVLPLYLFDHSGITISAGEDLVASGEFGKRQGGRDHFAFDPGGWDTSYVGFIFDTARTREVCGTPLDRIREVLEGEVKEYASFLEGDIWGYRVEERVATHTEVTRTKLDGSVTVDRVDTEEWEEVDSCWGFLGHKYAEEEARSAYAAITKPNEEGEHG